MSLFDIRGDGEIYYQGNRVGTLDIDILPSVEQEIFEDLCQYGGHEEAFEKGYTSGVIDASREAMHGVEDIEKRLLNCEN